MINYEDVKMAIEKIAELEQKVYDLSRQIEEKELNYEELLLTADAEGITKNDRQRKCFVDTKKKDDVEYQSLRKLLEQAKIQLNYQNRMYQLNLKFAADSKATYYPSPQVAVTK